MSQWAGERGLAHTELFWLLNLAGASLGGLEELFAPTLSSQPPSAFPFSPDTGKAAVHMAQAAGFPCIHEKGKLPRERNEMLKGPSSKVTPVMGLTVCVSGELCGWEEALKGSPGAAVHCRGRSKRKNNGKSRRTQGKPEDIRQSLLGRVSLFPHGHCSPCIPLAAPCPSTGPVRSHGQGKAGPESPSRG